MCWTKGLKLNTFPTRDQRIKKNRSKAWAAAVAVCSQIRRQARHIRHMASTNPQSQMTREYCQRKVRFAIDFEMLHVIIDQQEE
jgi:hypothetical protein